MIGFGKFSRQPDSFERVMIMKIKSIANLCKQLKRVFLFETESGIQWVGDGCALYPLFTIPKLGSDSVFAIFDITEKQKDKILFKSQPVPDGIDLDDIADGEIPIKDIDMRITTGGMTLIPLLTQTGLIFINEKYLAPLSDIPETMELFERMTQDGHQYIAVKSGMLIYGVVFPVDVIDDLFVSKMNSLTVQCKMALDNKKAEENGKIIRLDVTEKQDGENS